MNNKKNYDEIIELLKKDDAKNSHIQMPASLSGKKLLHLLPDNQEEKTLGQKVLYWITSKKAVPAYALAVVVLFAVVVFPRISGVGDLSAVDATVDPQVSGVEVQENGEQLITDEANDNATAGGAADAQGGSAQDNQILPDDNSSTPATNKPDEGGEDLSMYYDENGELRTKEPDSSSSGESSGDTSSPKNNDAPDAFYGGYDREKPSRSVSSGGDANDTQSSSPATGGADSPETSQDPPVAAFASPPITDDIGYYLGDWKGNTLYWKTAKSSDDYNILLEALNSEGKVVASHKIKGIHGIALSFVTADGKLIVIGSGASKTVVYQFSEISGTDFSGSVTFEIVGEFYDFKTKDNFLYVLTGMEKVPNTYSGETKKISSSKNTGAVGLLMINLSTNEIQQCVLLGTNRETIELTDQDLTLSYKNEKDENCKIKYNISGLSISEKK